MNPYNQLGKVAGVFSQKATLVKKDGTTFTLYVKPETRQTETLNAIVPAATTTREWTCAASDLNDDEANFPDAGDSLAVFSDDGTVKSYDVARDAQSGRFWDWRYLRPGYRIRFTTKFNPKEV